MTKEEKIQYLCIVFNICGYTIEDRTLDFIVTMYDALLKKKKKLDVETIVKLMFEVDNRHKQEALQVNQ